MERVDPIFYGDPMTAAMKPVALEAEAAVEPAGFQGVEILADHRKQGH
ncbi:MAG: hypothetical protein ACLQNE_25655 [Thermoguttaceae bacterium]